MTLAEEWEHSPDAVRLSTLLGERLTLKGARLFVAGYGRLRPKGLTHGTIAGLPEMIERVAYGDEPESGLVQLLRPTGPRWHHELLGNVVFADQRQRSRTWALPVAFRELLRDLDRPAALAHARRAAGHAPADVYPDHPWHETFQTAYYEHVRPTADLMRCVFANPYRPVAFAPEWRTDTAVAIARGMHEQREFSAMPILADALQDAGCDNDDVLNHCRGGGTHVRGCWVCDLVLEK